MLKGKIEKKSFSTPKVVYWVGRFRFNKIWKFKKYVVADTLVSLFQLAFPSDPMHFNETLTPLAIAF